MAKARVLRDRLVFVKTARGAAEDDAKISALEYFVGFLEFLEANNPKITEAIQRRLDTIDKVMTREERAKIALQRIAAAQNSNTS